MNSQQSERLLAYLKNLPLLAGYSLSIYKPGQVGTSDNPNLQLCGTQDTPHICRELCTPSLNAAGEEALTSRKAVFFRCPLGLLSFAIPVSADTCLACGGMRENLFDLYFHESDQFEFLKGKHKTHPYEILEQLEKLPVTTEKEARETMAKVERLIESFIAGEKPQPNNSVEGPQSAIRKIAEAIGKAESFKNATSLFCETLGILFDIPAIALALKDEENDFYLMESCWGAFFGPIYIPSNTLPFQEGANQPIILTGGEFTAVFPKVDMTSAICLPLVDESNFFGMAVLFDVSLTANDLQQAGLLTVKLVKKLKQNITDQKIRQNRREVRLLEMIRTLALTESQEELLRLIVDMAAELVNAEKGSLMLLAREGKILRVASALGINPVLAQNLYTRIGEGIAGRVAASGTPHIIRDIEQELDPSRKNRTRFAGKSCISLPLMFKGETFGVLNLADKKNNGPFTPGDQKILSTFLDQATTILERSMILRKAKQSITTDPLTGVYNLRFIKKRLNEEVSRSIRYNLQLTLIIARLDIFTAGHDPGEKENSDRLLKEMARDLGASLRDIDLIGRLGVNEFCVILPSTPMKDSIHVADRIKSIVGKDLSFGSARTKVNMVASIGIASFPENGKSSGELINAARSALFRAEAGGK